MSEPSGAAIALPELGALLMQAPLPICVLVGPDLVIALANPAYRQLVGQSDLVGKPLLDAVPELRGQPAHALVEGALRSAAPRAQSDVPVKIARWTGESEERHFHLYCQPLDVGGDARALLLAAFDATDHVAVIQANERLASDLRQSVAARSRAEQALRMSEERFRAALSRSAVTVCNQDRDLRYTWVHNPPPTLSTAQMLGKTDAEVLEDAEGARMLERIKRQVMATGIGQRREIALYLGERMHHFDVSIEPVRDDSGATTALTTAATDITDRIAMEHALRASEARFRTVQEASLDGLMILRSVRDPGGAIVDFEWVYANPAAEPVLGGRGKHLEGKRLLVELPRSAVAAGFDSYARVVETGQPGRIELTCSDDGTERSYRSVAVALGDGVAVSFHDITQQRRTEAERARLLEQEQRARQHAEQLNRLKDDFLATVSHELRTPLQSILGWARILRAGEVDAASFAKGLSTIERNAKAQSQLIEDILDASTIIAGKLRVRIEPVDVRQVLEAALDTVRPGALVKGVDIACAIEDDVGSVLADADRLQQAVWNLLSNAVKFTPRGGHVAVRARRANGHLEIEVADDGEGIPEAFLPLLFDRFQQADSGRSRAHGGLGLGLAIVRHLIEAQGGTVQAASGGEGKGATFSIRLPVNASKPPPAPPGKGGGRPSPNAAARRVLEGVRVLVVDDETDARELLGIIFRRSGATVREASSAAAAIEALRSGEFDVLVSDIGMPGEDGYAMIRRLRAMNDVSSCRIPALALTAYARLEDRRQALEAGFQMHLAKPIEPSSLVNAVAHVLGRSGLG